MGWWYSVVCGVLFESLLSLTNNHEPHPCMFYRTFVSLRSFEMTALCDSLYRCFSVHFGVEETDRKTFWELFGTESLGTVLNYRNQKIRTKISLQATQSLSPLPTVLCLCLCLSVSVSLSMSLFSLLCFLPLSFFSSPPFSYLTCYLSFSPFSFILLVLHSSLP